ncbi:MAG: diphosphomevalonate decarboxylase [Proteobacteria bacterium]|nr:diphosphomevalonate decarboxylase [Pseudomonadota bacterium]
MSDTQHNIPNELKATAKAHANIAVAKYWGKRNSDLNLPFFDSVSFNVEDLTTETTAVWNEDDFRDALSINGWQVPEHTLGRLTRILNTIRSLTGITKRCILSSKNNFPLSTGLASSASGYAAAAAAAAAAAGLELSESELSSLARLGSGSAARSIPAGWTRWHAGNLEDGSDSHAVSIAPPDHWPLHVFVIQVSEGPKSISSSEAMQQCQSSPYWPTYLQQASQAADFAQNAILQRDFAALTEAMHTNALQLHALAMTCNPPICFFAPKSIEILQHILRASRGIQVCCTLDAGANVVVLCEETAYPFVKNDIIAFGLPFVQSRIGGGVTVQAKPPHLSSE